MYVNIQILTASAICVVCYLSAIMNLKQYLIVMGISAALGWVTFIFLIIGFNPEEAGLGVFFLLYASFIMALASTLAISGLITRVWILRQSDIIPRQVSKSVRQAILLSIFLAGLMMMQSRGVLSWWLFVVFLIMLMICELLFISLAGTLNKK